jgi:hypothetical protein
VNIPLSEHAPRIKCGVSWMISGFAATHSQPYYSE